MPINPTPSTPTLRVISVGAGKDYATLQAAFNYLNGYDVTAGAQQILVEVYENQSIAGAAFTPKNPSANYYVTVQPVPGAGVNDLDTDTPLTYGAAGVQITINTANYYIHGDGVVFQNFRIQVNCGAGTDRSAALFSRYGQTVPTPSHMQHWQRCRVNLAGVVNPKALEVGNSSGEGHFFDNLFILDGATTATVIDTSPNPVIDIRRNTFVRTAAGAGHAISNNSNGPILNNAFVNLGATAVNTIAGGSGYTPPSINYSDYAGDTGRAGFTVATGLLQNTASDFRPATDGPLINAATASAQNTLDVRGNSRGLVPDIGADQLAPQAPVVAPTGAVTAQGPQVNQTYAITFSTANTPTGGVATLNPAATPNGAVLNTGAITFGASTATATFTNIVPGDYVPNITISNAGGGNAVTGAQPVTIIDTAPAANPTPSSPGFRVVSVGTGKDYASMATFAAYLRTQNLAANTEVLCAEVYEDQTITGLSFQPAGANDTYYCLIRPVPGRSVNDLETGAFTYGSSGIQLTAATAASGGNYGFISAGVQMDGFRVRITGSNAGDRAAFLMSNYGQTAGVSSVYQGFQSCRFSVEAACPYVIESGNTGGKVRVLDCLIVFAATSPAALLSDSYSALVLRNTFVRLGVAGKAIAQISSGTVADNVFCHMGMAASGTSVGSAAFVNNYSDNAADNKIGYTVAPVGSMLANATSDFRPKADGDLIAQGDAVSASVNDILGNNRGYYPDVGAYQLSIAPPLPKGSVSSQPAPDGQSLSITFSTQNTPTDGTATLVPDPDNPNGAVINYGTVTLGTNTGTASFTGIVPGNYNPRVEISNDGGFALVTGVQPVIFIGIFGTPSADDSTTGGGTITPPVDTAPPTFSGAITASGITSTSFTFSWPAATDNIGVAGYEVSIDGGATWTGNGTTTSKTIGGATTSTQYSVAVRARDAAGNTSAPLAATITTLAAAGGGGGGGATVPGAPTSVLATAMIGGVVVAFSPPLSNGGSALTGYIVKASTGQSMTVLASPAIMLLAAGVPVSFTVRAVNAQGQSADSPASNTVTPAMPGDTGGGTANYALEPAPRERVIRM